jgi:hypothetical protein
MSQIRILLILSMIAFAASAVAQESSGRIKRKPPSATEEEQIASDIAMNDSLLRKGDIVATTHGFLVFQGVAADGFSNIFTPIPNPLSDGKK